jgi:hypothetical protein
MSRVPAKMADKKKKKKKRGKRDFRRKGAPEGWTQFWSEAGSLHAPSISVTNGLESTPANGFR